MTSVRFFYWYKYKYVKNETPKKNLQNSLKINVHTKLLIKITKEKILTDKKSKPTTTDRTLVTKIL